MKKIYYPAIPIAILLAIAMGIGIKWQINIDNGEKKEATPETSTSTQNEVINKKLNQSTNTNITNATNTINSEEINQGLIRDANRVSDISSLRTAIALLKSIAVDPSLKCVAGKIYNSRTGSGAVDGSGWLPVDFTKIPGGSPMGLLMVDPTNNANYFYQFACDPKTNTFELDATFESNDPKFLERARTDGGDNPNVYEVGDNVGLKLIH